MADNTQPAGFTPTAFFPPARGLYNNFPFVGSLATQREGESPFLTGPPLATSQHFRQSETLLYLAEGQTELATSPLGANTQFRMLAAFDHVTFLTAIYNPSTFDSKLYIFNPNTNTFGASIETIETGSGNNNRMPWIFFRNRLLMVTPTNGVHWFDGTAARKAGVTTPSTAITFAADSGTGITGDYQYKYTYVNDQGHEGPPATASATRPVANKTINLTGITVGPTGTATRRVYRTTTGGAVWLFLTTINDNTTTTYADSTVDAGLGAALDSDTNTVPSDALRSIASTTNRVALLSNDGKIVYFSKIDPVTGASNWEAFPSSLSIEIPFNADGGISITFHDNVLYVFGRLQSFRIIGDVATGATVEKIFDAGLYTSFSYTVTEYGIFLFNQNHEFMRYKDGVLEDVGNDVQAIFNSVPNTSDAGVSSTTPFALEYDPRTDSILFTGSSGGGGVAGRVSGLVYSTKTKQFIGPMLWVYGIAFYNPFTKNLYGTAISGTKIYGWFSGIAEPTTYQYAVASISPTTPTAYIQFHPWTPIPGFDIDYGWVEIFIEAKPIVSSVVPTLKVEYALNGSATFTSKYVDFSKDFITRTSTEGTAMRAIRVLIGKVGRSLALRINSTPNVASTSNGVEIFGINIWARPLRESRDGHNNRQFA